MVLGQNSPLIFIIMMHIHAHILCTNFEVIPIKFRLLKNFKVAQKLGQRPWAI